MRRILTTAVAVAMASAAYAQTVTTTGPSSTTTTTSTTITPEVRTKVREYVVKQKTKSVAAPSGFTVTRGARLPETVEVQTFPADVGVRDYRYAVVGDRTVLVSGNREIIEVIE